MAAEEELESVRAELVSTVKHTYVEMKTDDLENRSSMKNLHMFALKEGAEGTQPLLYFFREMLAKWLGLCVDQTPVLERVHHILAPATNTEPFLYASGNSRIERLFIVFHHRRISYTMELNSSWYRTFQQKRCRNIGSLTQPESCSARWENSPKPCKMRVVHDGKVFLFSSPCDAEEFYREIQPKG